jgi:hypothetical protein
VGVVIGLRAAFALLTLGLRMLFHPLGQRVLAALVLIAMCAGLVLLVFTYPEPVEPEPGSVVPSGRAARPRADARPRPTSPASTPTRSAGSPEQAAVAWYARHERLSRDRVRVLQRDRVNRSTVRVLVLADRGTGRLDTAVVTVRRDTSGWRVGR